MSEHAYEVPNDGYLEPTEPGRYSALNGGNGEANRTNTSPTSGTDVQCLMDLFLFYKTEFASPSHVRCPFLSSYIQ